MVGGWVILFGKNLFSRPNLLWSKMIAIFRCTYNAPPPDLFVSYLNLQRWCCASAALLSSIIWETMLKCDSILMLQISKVIVTKEDSDSDLDSEFVGREEIRAPLKTPAWEAFSNGNRFALSRAQHGWNNWVTSKLEKFWGNTVELRDYLRFLCHRC